MAATASMGKMMVSSMAWVALAVQAAPWAPMEAFRTLESDKTSNKNMECTPQISSPIDTQSSLLLYNALLRSELLGEYMYLAYSRYSVIQWV